MKRIVLVVQRYGEEVNGGAEVLARWLAERLATEYQLEVFTTCAVDYRSWRNHYPAGATTVNGVAVTRFTVDREREVTDFDRHTFDLMHRPRELADEIAWIRAQGPYSTPLLEAISAAEHRVDAFIFFTYLYATTFFGLPLVADKAILVPTAHDEPFFYLEAFRELLRRPAALVYNTHAERDLVHRVAHNAHIPHITAGSGVVVPADVDPERFRTRHNIREPFLLYAGRITPAKNVPELLDFFTDYRRQDSRSLKLVLLGRATMPLPAHPDVVPLGFVTEEEKFDAIAAADAVVIPSRYESLSIIALEAWLSGTPVLVNGECAVLRQQVRRSNGGLYYSHQEEFVRVLNRLRADPHLRLILGAQGRRFARHHYGWDVIIARYRALLDTLF